MYRYGALSEEQLAWTRERDDTDGSFAAVALDAKLVTQEQLYKFLARQVEEVVLAVLMLEDGMFCFLDGFEDDRLASRQVISATAMLMGHVSRIDELRYFRPWIPSVEHVPEKAREGPPADEHAAVWAAIDGRRNVEHIGRVTGRSGRAVAGQAPADGAVRGLHAAEPPLRPRHSRPLARLRIGAFDLRRS